MPREDGLPPGTLVMLILRVLATQPLHGYAIAQRIAQLSHDELSVEEGSLYPALQKLLLKGLGQGDPRRLRHRPSGPGVPNHTRAAGSSSTSSRATIGGGHTPSARFSRQRRPS